ncbi:MAG: TetR/AcrR family transcriptional regulator, partial [Longimicrobiales bacterium]
MRRRILAAARELFEKHGYEGTTMRGIADRIDYTPTILYQHFESKDALISALVAEDFRVLTRGLVETGQVEDPVVRLVRAMEEYVEFALDHPRHYELTFMSREHGESEGDVVDEGSADAGNAGGVGPRPGSVRGDASRKVYAYLRLTCEEAIAMGRFREEFQDPDEVARMVWSTMHGAVSLHLARKEDPWIDWK